MTRDGKNYLKEVHGIDHRPVPKVSCSNGKCDVVRTNIEAQVQRVQDRRSGLWWFHYEVKHMGSVFHTKALSKAEAHERMLDMLYVTFLEHFAINTEPF